MQNLNISPVCLSVHKQVIGMDPINLVNLLSFQGELGPDETKDSRYSYHFLVKF